MTIHYKKIKNLQKLINAVHFQEGTRCKENNKKVLFTRFVLPCYVSKTRFLGKRCSFYIIINALSILVGGEKGFAPLRTKNAKSFISVQGNRPTMQVNAIVHLEGASPDTFCSRCPDKECHLS